MASAQVVKHILCNFMCEESDESEACEYCCECAQYLCETCAKQHTKIKKFKHHHYIRATVACLSGLDKAITTCPKHDGQELKYHCEDDGHSMCGECKEAHVGHHFIEIQDKCNDLMKSIGKRLSVPVPKDGIRKTKVEFTKRIENLSYLVKERNEFLKTKLDDMEYRLQEELKKYNGSIAQFFDEKIEKAEEKERIRKTFEQDVSIREGASLYQYLIDLDKRFGKMSDAKSKPGIPTLIDTSIDVQTDGQKYLAALQVYINGPLKGDSEDGCEHYKRKCRLLTPCCNKVYTCHHCHDNNENHTLKRSDVTMVICISCTTVQSVMSSGICCVCDIQFAVYTCTKCVLYDMEYKFQYHCDKCGLCRIGPEKNFYHCDTCDLCVNKSMEHECTESSERAACPVCNRLDIKFTREPCRIFSCNHFYHLACFNKIKGNHSGQGKCPKCLED